MAPLVPGTPGLPIPSPASALLDASPGSAPPIARRVLAVAHRGASTEHRENTIAAFARALDLGADGIELDVRITRDGVVVVHHDEDVVLEPTASAGGRRFAIERLTLAELRQVDFGDGAGIPTLDEVMELVAGRAEVFVELKRPVSEVPVIACVERHRGPFALHSFDHAAIARVAARAPHIRRGILFDDPLVDAHTELAVHLARTQAHDVWPRRDHVTRESVAAARLLGARVIPWTVNDGRAGIELAALGVDGICTDDIRWLRALQQPLAAGSPPSADSTTLAPPPMSI